MFHNATQDNVAQSHKVAASVIDDMVMEQSKKQSTGRNEMCQASLPEH